MTTRCSICVETFLTWSRGRFQDQVKPISTHNIILQYAVCESHNPSVGSPRNVTRTHETTVVCEPHELPPWCAKEQAQLKLHIRISFRLTTETYPSNQLHIVAPVLQPTCSFSYFHSAEIYLSNHLLFCISTRLPVHQPTCSIFFFSFRF